LPQLVHGEIRSSPHPGTLPTQQHHIHIELHWTRPAGGSEKADSAESRPVGWWSCPQLVTDSTIV
jgi:hypothetical protein